MSDGEHIKLICKNRKAWFNFEIDDSFEAGVVLTGPEVKSLRAGKANLGDAYAKIKSGEIFLIDAHISPYDKTRTQDQDPVRDRKLLMHKREIKKLTGKAFEKGFSIVPLRMYFKNGKVKVELALAKGKKAYDKRESIRKKDQRREMERLVKFRQR
ncbi:MAG: SsrA-binding protein SmpB [Thermodesulfobacteriota bacterium]